MNYYARANWLKTENKRLREQRDAACALLAKWRDTWNKTLQSEKLDVCARATDILLAEIMPTPVLTQEERS